MMRRRFLRETTCVLGGAMALSNLSGCLRAEPPLRVAITPWLGYETLNLARELGYIQEPDIRLVEFPSNTVSLMALANHEVPLATLTLDEFLLAREGGLDLRVVLVFDESMGGDAVIARPGINSLADIKGKRIGVESTATGALMMAKLLEAAHLQPADVVKVEMTVDQHASAYASGKVDVLVTFEPVLSRLKAQGAKLLLDSRQYPGLIVDVLVARADALTQSDGHVRTLMQAYFKALSYWDAHQDQSAALVAPRLQLQTVEVMQAMKGMHMMSLSDNRVWLSGAQPRLLESVRTVGEMAVRARLLKTAPSPANVIDARFLEGLA